MSLGDPIRTEGQLLQEAVHRLGNTVSDLIDVTEGGLDSSWQITKRLVAAVEELHGTTKTTAAANERMAQRLIKLTWALVFLTAVIALLTIALLLRPTP